jgi:hypothetical protein
MITYQREIGLRVKNVASVIKMKQLTLFKCQHAMTIWRVVNIATGLTPPKSINHMFGNWLTGIKKKDKSLIYVGIVALMWVI